MEQPVLFCVRFDSVADRRLAVDLVAQSAAQNFSDCRFREGFAEFDIARHFVISHIFAAEIDQLVAIDSLTVDRNHEGTRNFAAGCMSGANDNSFFY